MANANWNNETSHVEIIDDRSYMSGAPIDPVFRQEWENRTFSIWEKVDQIIALRSDKR